MDARPHRLRLLRRWPVVIGAVGAITAAAIGFSQIAYAATLFSDNFESGLASTWSKSGGTWGVVADGSQALRQSSATSENAREFNGSTSWTTYAVQARVKPISLGSGGFAGLLARSTSATKFYRLALLSGNTVQLQSVSGSSVTVIGSISRTVAANTWYTLRLDVNGSTIRGTVDGVQVGQGTNSDNPAGRIGFQTAFSTASFDDVTVDSSTTTPPTTNPPTSTTRPPTSTPPTTRPPTSAPPTTGPTAPPQTGIVGWATQGGGTTGGAGGPTVTVTSLAALTTAVSTTTAQIVRVSGNFTCSDDVRVMGNKTILGVGSSSGLTGCGINIRGVSNVIVRNMRISKVQASSGNGDAIHIDSATRLWLDHNDLSSDITHGTDFYDGLLDITHGADYITVSWNILHDHIKCSLVGHSDSNASEDTGHLRVTYHHNEFSNCAERGPRVRFANPVHVYNNYYTQNTTFDYSYGVATTEGAGVLVESNYFENIPEPTHLSEGDSSGGNLVARNNVLVNSGPILTTGSVASIPYSYQVDAAANVKSIVTAGAGTGKIAT